MLDYDKEFNVQQHFEVSAESIQALCNLSKGEGSSIKNLNHLISSCHTAIYAITCQQFEEKEEPLTKDEYLYALCEWHSHTAMYSTPNLIYGDPLYKVLERQPLESLDYLFESFGSFSHAKVHLVLSVLKSYGMDLSDGLFDKHKQKFHMFKPNEQTCLALKSLWNDIKKEGLHDYNRSA